MSTTFVSRHDAMSVGAIAALLALLITLGVSAWSNRGPQDPKRQDPQAEAPRFVGDPPAPLAESTTVVLQTTPEELTASVLAARARNDLAALARCCSTTVGRASLDRIDAARAERDFVEGGVLWDRLATAAKANTLRFVQVERPTQAEDGTTFEASGTIAFPSGSRSIDELHIEVVRNRGAWFVKVSP